MAGIDYRPNNQAQSKRHVVKDYIYLVPDVT